MIRPLDTYPPTNAFLYIFSWGARTVKEMPEGSGEYCYLSALGWYSCTRTEDAEIKAYLEKQKDINK